MHSILLGNDTNTDMKCHICWWRMGRSAL